MKTKNITLSPEAINAIEGLQHTCGTYPFYSDTLSRLYNFILTQSDEIGMDATETLHTLRALYFLKADLAYIAGRDRTPIIYTQATDEETAERVEATFEDLQDSAATPPGDQLDEPREMLADVKRAWQRLNEVQTIISEAITHAQNAGEKYESIIFDLADVNGNLESTAAALDAVMAIDPDNYEPKELTEAEQTALLVQRSRDALTYGKELLGDALDHAVRADLRALSEVVSTVQALTGAALNHIAGLTAEEAQ